jgi:hypothetical protein
LAAPKHLGGIGPALRPVGVAPPFQKRARLAEKHQKGRPGRIRQAIDAVLPAAMLRQGLKRHG